MTQTNEIEELKEAIASVYLNLNQCMAQQAAMQHAIYALMEHVSNKQAVVKSLQNCAESFLSYACEDDDMDLPEEMLAVYQAEIDEFIATLKE